MLRPGPKKADAPEDVRFLANKYLRRLGWMVYSRVTTGITMGLLRVLLKR